MKYEALLVVSFGGPEKHEDVIPFLENVLRGRNVPRERLSAVAEHYYHFGGRSPINDQCRALIAALKAEGINIPIYWGNRNWHPLLPDTVARMKADGVERALAFMTSAFSSYSGCRQYRENVAAAIAEAGGGITIDKLPGFHNHPGFIAAMKDRVADALTQLPSGKLIFTAHSVPVSMAASSRYVQQLEEAAALIAGGRAWRLCYQSRSGPPTQAWLEPDILDLLREEMRDVVVIPLGFLSDHMEVLYDLDTEARELAKELGIGFVRAGTAGTHPRFISMIREQVERGAIANCAPDCCLPPIRPAQKA